MNKKIVLFLGAGFSCDAGLPIMSNFGLESARSYRGISKHFSKGPDPRLAADMLMEAAKKFHQFQEVCKNSSILDTVDINNMETIFCIAEAICEAGEKNVKLEDEFYDVNKLRRDIQLWLWKVYQQFPPLNNERKMEVEEQTYTDFFKLLSPENTTIITTNYDLVFEYYSLKQGVPCFYPVKHAKEICIDSGKNKYAFLSKEEKDKCFTICKLHGSVNSFYKDKNEKHEIYISNELGDKMTIGKSGLWRNLPVIFAVDAIVDIQAKYGADIVPAIVPPTYSKFTQEVWLREIWNAAFKAMREAEKIIFIGYSMPESDGFMKALFNGALATRDKSNNLEVYLIDSSKETFDRYHKFWKKLLCGADSPMNLNEAIKDYMPKILK